MKISVQQLIWLTMGAISVTMMSGFGHLFIRHHQATVRARPIVNVNHATTNHTDFSHGRGLFNLSWLRLAIPDARHNFIILGDN
ncbi:cell surface protein [Lactiplantibacillus paraplantarum]|uniref:Cell surface protein n=1 Tax=Lactiplantibacillus paraplantarum TaxID=60520 RepID=A0ABQ0NEV1_9LACO|nr:hypothetical protein CK401_00592 [Lactiplantibacillus paraplantarum]GBF02972.1 cell surface protein [Lactiplantibacillus paraplantarum]